MLVTPASQALENGLAGRLFLTHLWKAKIRSLFRSASWQEMIADPAFANVRDWAAVKHGIVVAGRASEPGGWAEPGAST